MTKIVTETAQDSTFFEYIQTNCDLDLRDERGKRLHLTIVLLGIIIALLCGKDGNLSIIHRSMKNTPQQIYEFYKCRAAVEILFDTFKNILFADVTYTRSN